jgi:molecular chaperone GrpE (heat shock protein)
MATTKTKALSPAAQPAEPARKPAKSRAPRKTEAAGPVAETAATATPAVADPALAAPTPATDGFEESLRHLLQGTELKLSKQMDAFKHELQGLLAPKPAPAPENGSTTSFDEDIEGIARTVKRAMVEVFERNGDRTAHQLAKIRRHLDEAAKRVPEGSAAVHDHLAACAHEVTGLLAELGVESFDAQVGEFFDPMIHQCAADGARTDVEPGRVLESIAPGYRSWRGTVVLPALTIVNRR